MLTKEQIALLKAQLESDLNEIETRNQEKIIEMENNTDPDKFHGDEGDQAIYMEQRRRLLRLRDRDRKLINKIRKTLDRINDGTYGICESCGMDISFERLKTRPVATLCIDCKREQEEKEERDRHHKIRYQ